MHSKKEKKTKSSGETNKRLNNCTLLGSVHKSMQKKTDRGYQEEVIFQLQREMLIVTAQR